jgi:O-antigen/teichoic acid export membrane protein
LLRSLASNWLALGVGIAISFFLSPFVVNKLGAAWYGVWAVASQFTGYLYLLDFGVRESVIRYTAKYVARGQAAQLNRVLTTALYLYGGITLLGMAATALVVWRLPYWFDLEPQYWHDARVALACTGGTIASVFLFNVFNGIMIGLRQWEISNAVGIVFNLLRTAVLVFFLMRGHGIVAVAAIQFGTTFIGGLLTAVMSMRMLRNRGLRFHFAPLTSRRFRDFTRRIFGYGFYVIVNNVGSKIISASDAIIVGIYLPIAQVAYFAIGGSLVDYLRTLLGTTAGLFNPLASHLKALGQRQAVTDAFMFGVKLTVLITLPVATVFVLLGDHFIGLWMGAEFAAPAGQVLAILAIGAVLTAPQFVFSSVLYGLGKPNIIATLRIIEGAANLGLSILLVQLIGLPGVALGTAIPSVIMVMVVLPLVAGRPVGLHLRSFYLAAYVRPAIAIVPSALAAAWIHHSFPASNLPVFFGQVALVCLVYLPCAFFVVLNANERRQLVQRFRLPAFLAPPRRA